TSVAFTLIASLFIALNRLAWTLHTLLLLSLSHTQTLKQDPPPPNTPSPFSLSLFSSIDSVIPLCLLQLLPFSNQTILFQKFSHMIIQRTRQPTAASYKSLGNVTDDLARLSPSLTSALVQTLIFLRFCQQETTDRTFITREKYTTAFNMSDIMSMIYQKVILLCVSFLGIPNPSAFRVKLNQIPVVKQSQVEPSNFLILVVVSMVFIVMVLGMSGALYCLRHRSHHRLKEKLVGLGNDNGHDATAAYQDLCRQRMAVQTSERGEKSEVFHPSHTSRINSVSSQFSDGPMQSPSARSSTSSWSEEPTQTNMDISTGHMILSYMEDHLQNKDRLDKEWEALCSYQAEPAACTVGQQEQNVRCNRPHGVLVYDHSRVILKAENNQSRSDYINASPIMDHDPRNPAYICAQGPLPTTVADFWQMVWESGCVVIVMLTPLAENGIKQCHQYWPDEGSDLYHIYEVNLVSEHIWCDDFLVRSFYLKNVQTNETRTVTQFHFLSWMDQNVPESARTLLDFRRKVNKCYRGRSCPIIVHCSDGAGRSGTYILIDMVLNKMAKVKCKIVSNCSSTVMICLVNALALCCSNDNICPKDAPLPSAFRTLSKQVLMCEIDLAPKNPFYPIYFWSRIGMFCALAAT
ncbi:receptor-type tyrosine-protein phosphatase N2 precursor, partial [Triplophysa rosa]